MLGELALGDFRLENGEVLAGARLHYRTYGMLNEDKSNAIVYPTWFMGTHEGNEWLIGGGMALDPNRFFIVVPNMFGNGVSSSPSNTAGAHGGSGFPLVTYRDQVRAQHQLVTSIFGIERLYAVVGWSMGAAQTFQWAVSYPNMVARIMPFCGSARTSEHNHVFLDSVAAAIGADPGEPPLRGLRAAARVYAGWGFSQAFYWHRLYTRMGFVTREEFVRDFWEDMFTQDRDADDILAMIRTWKSGDVGQTPGFDGDLEAALRSISAKTIVLAAERDLYFCAEDAAYEAAHIPGAHFRIIPGVWGHSAGAGVNPLDSAYIDAVLRELLDS
jgi:homoserine O-acetyltransferase